MSDAFVDIMKLKKTYTEHLLRFHSKVEDGKIDPNLASEILKRLDVIEKLLLERDAAQPIVYTPERESNAEYITKEKSKSKFEYSDNDQQYIPDVSLDSKGRISNKKTTSSNSDISDVLKSLDANLGDQ